MAYKFQAGEAILSGNLLQEGDVEIESGFNFKVHEQTILDTSRNLANVGTISGSGLISGPAVSVDLDVTVGADVIMAQGGNVYLAGDGGSAKILSSGGNAVSIFGAKVVTAQTLVLLPRSSRIFTLTVLLTLTAFRLISLAQHLMLTVRPSPTLMLTVAQSTAQSLVLTV